MNQDILKRSPSNDHASTCLRISGLAYADDTVWIARNKHDLEEIMMIAHSFFELNDLQINGSKLELIIINSSRKPEDRFVDVGLGANAARVHAALPNDMVRYLGVYLTEKGGSKHVIKSIKTEIADFVTTLSHKKKTMAHITYINNKVLIPRIEYRTKLTFIQAKQANALFAPMQKLYKHTLGCVSTAPNYIVTHNSIGGLKSITKIMQEHHFTKFVIRINDNKWMGITTRVRLAQAQQRIGLAASILIAELISLINWDMDRNLNFNVLKEMKLQLYSFNDSRLDDTWMDTYQATSLNHIFEDVVLSCDNKQSVKIRKSFLLRSQKTLIFTSLLQLLTPDNTLLPWYNLMVLYNLPVQGQAPL